MDRYHPGYTGPFLRAPEVSPGTRAEFYHQNTATYLDLGKALGEGMLGLLKDE